MENTNIWAQIFGNPAVVGIIITVVTTILTYLAAKLKTWLDAKVGKEKVAQALTMAEIIASGVEQMASQMGWDSQQKFDEALARLRDWAGKHGIKYSDLDWEAIIERTVLAMSCVWKTLKNGKCDLENSNEGNLPPIAGFTDSTPN